MDLGGKIPNFRRDFSTEEFVVWKEMINDYLLAKNIIKPERKIAVMRVIGGSDLVELLRDLPGTEAEDEFEQGIAKLSSFFEQMANPIKERMEFRKLAQNQGEKIKEFVVRLRKKVRSCQFSEPEKEIFDQLVNGTTDLDLKKKALRGKLIKVEQLESEGAINETLNQSLYKETEINAIQASNKRSKIVCYNCSEEGHIRRNCTKAVSNTIHCFVCSKPGHIATKCPEKNVMRNKNIRCFACNGVGHIARTCPNVGGASQAKRAREAGGPSGQVTKKAKLESTNNVKEETINFLNGGKNVDCKIGGAKMTLLIDSGCASNIIDAQGMEMLRIKNAKIDFTSNVDKKFVPFGAVEPMKAIGSFMAKLEIADKAMVVKFYVLDVKARCLLGAESAQEIGLLKIGLDDVSNQ